MTVSKVTIWVDPGKTTGIATWRSGDDYGNGVFYSFQTPTDDMSALGKWLELMVLTTDSEEDFTAELGWERYIITPGNTRHGTAYWSIETIGMLKYICEKYEIVMLEPQVSSMMTVCPDDRLKAIGWYKPGKPHANDAARHLFRYMIKTGKLPDDLKNRAFGTLSEYDGGEFY